MAAAAVVAVASSSAWIAGAGASTWCDPALDPSCPPAAGDIGDPGTTWYDDGFSGDPETTWYDDGFSGDPETTWYDDGAPGDWPEPTRTDDGAGAPFPTMPDIGPGLPDALAFVDDLGARGEELDPSRLPPDEAAVVGAARLVLGIDALAELGAFQRDPDPFVNATIRTIRERIPADGLDDDGYRSEIRALSQDLDELVDILAQAGPVGFPVIDVRDALTDPDLLARLEDGETALFEPLTWLEASADLLVRAGQEPGGEGDQADADIAAILALTDRLAGAAGSPSPPDSTTTSAPPTLEPDRASPSDEPSDTDADADPETTFPPLLPVAGIGGALLLLGGGLLLRRRRPPGSVEPVPPVGGLGPTSTTPATEPAGPAVTASQSQTSIEDLLDVSRRLTASLDATEVAAIALTEAERLVQGEGGLLATRDGDGFRVLCHRPASLFDLDAIGAGSLRRVIETGRSIVQITDDEPALVEVPMAMAAIPIVADGRVVGAILVVRVSSMPFARQDLDGLEMLAPLIGSALLSAETHGSATQLADIDPLSGLSNRRRLTADLEAGGDHPMVAIMIDIDHFKTFNDTNGHAAGDEALRRVAAVLAENVRPGDVAYRYGGEEFCVLLVDTELDEALAVAERLRSAVEAVDIPGAEHQPAGRVTISVGVARTSAGDHDQVVERADAALYEAKHGGRNRVVSAQV